ncbi:hypothetical protein GCM10010271_67880 [Streptomyces kurssanovii]|nr:hypothetical protein GCM10010271_67880 [Streptomyces kurssanovii]
MSVVAEFMNSQGVDVQPGFQVATSDGNAAPVMATPVAAIAASGIIGCAGAVRAAARFTANRDK